MTYLYSDITEKIIKCFYEVYNIIGYGFLEKVYEISMYEELLQPGLYAKRQLKCIIKTK